MESCQVGNAAGMAGRSGALAIGGSAGAVEALVTFVARLPADLPVPVLVTVHIGNVRSSLPQILTRAGPLPARHARHGEPLRRGRIYVAPPDLHLLATAGVARLSSGPRVNRHRPAVDVMFASAARWAGPGLVAVVLSGTLDDGAVGAALTARAGGRVLVQDPADALFDSMPRATRLAVRDAASAPAPELAALAVAALDTRRSGHPDETGDDEEADEMVDTRMGDSDDPAFLSADEVRLTRLSCPECNGGMAEIDLSGLRYYRCHVGHQYSPQSLEASQRESVEAKLWAAAAALEEHAALARHLSTRSGLGAEVTDGYRRVADRSSDTARSLLSRLEAREAVAPQRELDGGPAPTAG